MRFPIINTAIWTQDIVYTFCSTHYLYHKCVVYWLVYSIEQREKIAHNCGYKFGFVITKIRS